MTFLRLAVKACLTLATLSAAQETPGQKCKCGPTDNCWPSIDVWDELNSTVSGRLIKTVPLGSVCHDPTYDQQACNALKTQWNQPLLHQDSSSSVMMPFFANDSCSPFDPASKPCTLGNYPHYTIKVLNEADVQAGIRFTQKHNIRLVIRNTGHEYVVLFFQPCPH